MLGKRECVGSLMGSAAGTCLLPWEGLSMTPISRVYVSGFVLESLSHVVAKRRINTCK